MVKLRLSAITLDFFPERYPIAKFSTLRLMELLFNVIRFDLENYVKNSEDHLFFTKQ